MRQNSIHSFKFCAGYSDVVRGAVILGLMHAEQNPSEPSPKLTLQDKGLSRLGFISSLKIVLKAPYVSSIPAHIASIESPDLPIASAGRSGEIRVKPQQFGIARLR